MKRILAAAALLAVTSTVAFAADQSQPGTPGDPNCFGQTFAHYAQVYKYNSNFAGAQGIGGVADLTTLSVKQIKALAEAYCAQ